MKEIGWSRSSPDKWTPEWGKGLRFKKTSLHVKII